MKDYKAISLDQKCDSVSESVSDQPGLREAIAPLKKSPSYPWWGVKKIMNFFHILEFFFDGFPKEDLMDSKCLVRHSYPEQIIHIKKICEKKDKSGVQKFSCHNEF